MGNTINIKSNLEDALQVLSSFIADEENLDKIDRAADILTRVLLGNGKVLSCGNGGSMCDAMHFAEELTGRFRENRKALPGIAIADPAHLTCVANDFGFDQVFSRYIEAHGKAGDALLAISTSGNSRNIIKAIEAAHLQGMKVVGLSGKDGGRMKDMCDVNICIPWDKYSDRIQELHIKIIHILIDEIERRLEMVEE